MGQWPGSLTLEETLGIDDALKAQSYFEGGPLVWARGEVEPALAKAAKVVAGTIEIG